MLCIIKVANKFLLRNNVLLLNYIKFLFLMYVVWMLNILIIFVVRLMLKIIVVMNNYTFYFLNFDKIATLYICIYIYIYIKFNVRSCMRTRYLLHYIIISEIYITSDEISLIYNMTAIFHYRVPLAISGSSWVALIRTLRMPEACPRTWIPFSGIRRACLRSTILSKLKVFTTNNHRNRHHLRHLSLKTF